MTPQEYEAKKAKLIELHTKVADADYHRRQAEKARDETAAAWRLKHLEYTTVREEARALANELAPYIAAEKKAKEEAEAKAAADAKAAKQAEAEKQAADAKAQAEKAAKEQEDALAARVAAMVLEGLKPKG